MSPLLIICIMLVSNSCQCQTIFWASFNARVFFHSTPADINTLRDRHARFRTHQIRRCVKDQRRTLCYVSCSYRENAWKHIGLPLICDGLNSVRYILSLTLSVCFCIFSRQRLYYRSYSRYFSEGCVYFLFYRINIADRFGIYDGIDPFFPLRTILSIFATSSSHGIAKLVITFPTGWREKNNDMR